MTAGRDSGAEAAGGGGLQTLTRRLLRRRWMNVALAQAAWALSLAAVALIVLLVAGAEVIEGKWLAAWAAGAATVALLRIVRRRPRPYPLLQDADRRLGLHDTLSTAYYFRRLAADPQAQDEVRATLFSQAERLARQVDATRAEPLRAPRSLWVLAALAAIASSLFALRYGVTGHLDLRPPLAAAMWPRANQETAGQARAPEPTVIERVRRMLDRLSPQSEAIEVSARRRGQSLTHEGGAAVEFTAAPPRPDLSQPVPTGASEEGGELDRGEGLTARAGDGPAGDQQGAGSEIRQPWNNENSDLLEKFREALASLLSQLKSRSTTGNSQGIETSEGMTASARSERRRAEKGTPGSGRQSQGEGNSEADGEQESEAAQRAQGASGKSGGPDTDLQPAREGRSGIGREDGRKDTVEAEQLAAIGKLTELIGRRQAMLTGEVTVEVASGTQKLRTPYTDQQAKRAEAGGEAHRDEVPLIFREYVQRYLEEIRKVPPPPSEPANQEP